MSKSYYENLFDDRKEFCDSLTNFISKIKPPGINLLDEEYPEEIEDTRVISIDAAWGYGKTTFMKALNEKLKNNDYTVFTFNAWANDYEGDPLESFINEVIPQMLKEINYDKYKEDETAETISLLLAAGNELIRKFSKFDVIEYIQRVQSNKKYIKTNLNKKNSLRNFEKDSPFSKQKKDFITSLNTYYNDVINIHKNRSNKKIVILIDELDRCKPTFAIELLERIKHLFDTGRYLFIFTINSKQLIESVKQIYGNCFDESGYFRRFFSFEFFLPDPNVYIYLRKGLNKYNINPDFINLITTYFENQNISLRDCDKIIDFIKLIKIQIKNEDSYLTFSYLAFAILIKFINQELFEKIFIKNYKNNPYFETEKINYINGIFESSFKFYKILKQADSPVKREITFITWVKEFSKAQKIGPFDQVMDYEVYYRFETTNPQNYIEDNFYFLSKGDKNFIDLDKFKLNSIILFGNNLK